MPDETLSAPVLERPPARGSERRQQSALQRLTDQARQRVDELIWALQRIPGRPYADELVAVTSQLHNRNIEGAIQAWHAIPWTYENERGYGGLAVCEARDARVKTAAQAVETALARLRVCFRYGYIPEPVSLKRPAQAPLLF